METMTDKERSFGLGANISAPSQQSLKIHHLSHDLRGPLNSILGFAELLLEGIEGPLSEVQKTDITAIYQSARSLLQLINNIVDLSKLEANQIIIDVKAVDLRQVTQSVLEANPLEAIEIVVNMPDTLPLLRGDRTRIEQMISNLIRFAAKLKKKGHIDLVLEPDGETVTIQVAAKEVVIPPEQLDELFELVVKVDPAGRSELGRGGLILPLARGLAEKHEGQMSVESEAGIGTTFYLRLPVYEETQ